MITADVRDWLSENFKNNLQIYNGPLFNTTQNNLMSVQRGVSQTPLRTIGDKKLSGYERLACNCILHWNNSYKETEEQALIIRDFLLRQHHPTINQYEVVLILIRNFVPIGMDENDIFEYAIDFEIVFKRLKKGLEGEE